MERTIVKARGIFAGGDDSQIYQWMEFSGGLITALGGEDTSPILEDSSEVLVIDLPNYFILPGLIDSHIHLGEQLLMKEQSSDLLSCDLKPCTSMQQVLALLEEKTKRYTRTEAGPIIVGTGWHESQLGSVTIKRSHLDSISLPVALFRNCFHLCVLNTAALEFFGLVEANNPISNKPIIRPALHQEISEFLKNAGDDVDVETGHCRETSVFEIRKFIYQSYPAATKIEMFDRGLQACLRNGVTSVQTNDFYGAWDYYRKMSYANRLPIRVFLTVPLDEVRKCDDAQIVAGTIPLPDDSAGLLSCHRVKIFADGSLGAKTAALREPYCSHGGGGGHHGVLIMTHEQLVEAIQFAHGKDYRLEIHVIGDKAAETVLDALKEVGVTPDDRPILTHCQVLGADLIRRMAEQGAIANVQPSFLTSDGSWVEADLGKERMRFAYAWKSLIDGGVVVAGGSDAPVELPNPFEGMHAAIYRTIGDRSDSTVVSPTERLSFKQACLMYTYNGAYTAGEEDRLGLLKPGYKADFVVIDRPVWESSFERAEETWSLLREVKVKQVWVDGIQRLARK